MTDFPVRPGGADAVLAAARVRRLRRALASGGAALALTAVPLVVVASAGAPRNDSLVAVSPTVTSQPAEAPASASPSASASSSDPTPSPPSSAASPTSSPPAVPEASEDTESPVISRPATTPRPPRQSAAAPVTRSSSTIETVDLCDGGLTDATSSWCARYTGPATARRGQSVLLSFELCRYPTAGDATISYDSELEVDAYVGSYDTPDWRAGQGIAYSATPHSEVLRAGSCIVWSSPWDTRGADGFLVVPGEYSFSGSANAVQGLPGASGSFRVVA
ncbi:MAG: hypothetical protein Q8R60_08025 [Mycobacteriales bacterium]|nr:hypothetical protein [Mycobacteriales bacterium]